MIRDFDAMEEVRKHPGVTAGGLALIVLGAAAAVYLSQRSVPAHQDTHRPARLGRHRRTAGAFA